MPDLEPLLDRLESLMHELDALDEPVREPVFAFLDGIDELHRMALRRLAAVVGTPALAAARAREPAVAWLLDAYGIGVDDRAAAEAALQDLQPYVSSHDGQIEVLDVTDGVVTVRLGGNCEGCTASAITLEAGVRRALQDRVRGFVDLKVIENKAATPHPPPGPTLQDLTGPEHGQLPVVPDSRA